MREAGVKERGARKTIRIVPQAPLPKPAWIRVRAASPNSRFYDIKKILREQKLHTVCEEASCPNIAECFGKGTATFMILGDICTRRCPFCDVAHGRPLAPDAEEPPHLAETIALLRLSYVVITSVDRDDLRDGGAQHFVDCISRGARAFTADHDRSAGAGFPRPAGSRARGPQGGAAGRDEPQPRDRAAALPQGAAGRRLRALAAPAAGIQEARIPRVPTKSGLMVGLGETDEEIIAVMRDLRAHDVDMLTIGQYLQPSPHHLPVERYVEPAVFAQFERRGAATGLQACRRRADGALVLPRRPAGPRSRSLERI